MVKTLIRILLIICTLVFIKQYYKRKNFPYNEEGVYFDQKTLIVYHQQTVEILVILSIVTILLLIITFFNKTKEK
jgi:hypothetical protein